LNKSEVVGSQLVVARRNPTALLDPVEETLESRFGSHAQLVATYSGIPVDRGDLIVRLVTWAMKGTDEASAD